MELTLKQAQFKLKQARKKAKKLREEINHLRTFIAQHGIDPDKKIDYTPRNKLIYQLYRSGEPFTSIGKQFNLSSSYARSICHRINRRLAKKDDKYKIYIE